MSKSHSNGAVSAKQSESTIGDNVSVSPFVSAVPLVSVPPLVSDPQVVPGNSEFGNRYPRAFKLKVLRETDACTKSGELGKYLRRMGVTHATLTCFRRQRAAGTLDASVASVSQAKLVSAADPSSDRSDRVEQTRRLMELERENRKLRRQLDQAETVIEIQKKVSHLLEISLDSSTDNSQVGPAKTRKRSG